MAQLKAFISSTCYDLGMVRYELRNFISSIGHEPIMSDFNDVLFDPKEHTHESCIKEIQNSDVVILIIGSRYGGKAIPKAINNIDIENLKELSKSTKLFENPNSISITQLEILKAIESNIPIFTFVDSRVLAGHLFYEKNKEKPHIGDLDFPPIENKNTAIYIFEFINFLRLRNTNNSIIEFSKISDIEDFIKKQWSALLQRFLFEQKFKKNEQKRFDYFNEELKDIKSLILTTISSVQAKEVGRGVLKYRRLLAFLLGFNKENPIEILLKTIEWDELLRQLDIASIEYVDVIRFGNQKTSVFFVRNDGTFYELRNMIPDFYNRMREEWYVFKNIPEAIKREIIDAITDDGNYMSSNIRFRDQQFKDFLIEVEAQKQALAATSKSSESDPDDEESDRQYSQGIINQHK